MFRCTPSVAALLSLGIAAVVLPGIVTVRSAYAQEATITIPERTEVKLALMQELKSGDVKEGADVEFEVRRDVLDDKGKLLLKAGTPAIGKVTQSKHRGAFGAPGKLKFTCDYVLAPGNIKVPLRATSISSYGKDNRGATVATAVLLAPVALFINGRDVTVKKGEEYTLYVDKTTTLGGSSEAQASAPTTPSASASGKVSGPKSVYLTKDGKAYVGALVSFDGSTYTVKTDSGEVKIASGDVKSVTPVQ